MASKGMQRLGGLILAVVLASQLGCQEKLMRERDALWTQNQELQEALSHQQQALEACETDRDRLGSQIDRLQAQGYQQAAAVATPPPPVMADTAFSEIEGVETEQTAEAITVRVPGDVLFSPGRVDLKGSAQKTLDKIANVIKTDYASKTVRVEGYTDTDPIRKSKWADNLELSLQRAATVHRYLQKLGVDPSQMEAVGLGQWSPRQSKAKSRRVEIVVLQ